MVNFKISIKFSYTKILFILIIDYEAIEFHKKIAEIQRQTYNSHKKDIEFLKEKILIELDYKQKIVVGMNPRQVNKEYYNQISRSLLGNF